MKKLYNILTYPVIVALTTIVSCGQNHENGKSNESNHNTKTFADYRDSVIKNGNIITTISTDIDKLGKLLDLKTYKPIKVKFMYSFIDNSAQYERLSVPGPSDFFLQALLYFDSVTFEKILYYDRYAKNPSPNYNKEEFMFDWLDKEILEELNNSNEHYQGHPDIFFGKSNSKAWYLDKKILLIKWTN